MPPHERLASRVTAMASGDEMRGAVESGARSGARARGARKGGCGAPGPDAPPGSGPHAPLQLLRGTPGAAPRRGPRARRRQGAGSLSQLGSKSAETRSPCERRRPRPNAGGGCTAPLRAAETHSRGPRPAPGAGLLPPSRPGARGLDGAVSYRCREGSGGRDPASDEGDICASSTPRGFMAPFSLL